MDGPGSRWIAVGALALAAAGGCSGNGARRGANDGRQARRDALPGVTALRDSTTTTSPKATAYGFEPNPNQPPIQNAGTDYVAIAKSLLAYSLWLEASDPEPSLVANIAAQASTFDRALRSDIA